MGNKRMILSGNGKEILELLCVTLEVDRPQGIKIALAKGISNNEKNSINIDNAQDYKATWTIPDNIIKDREYLLFKHLIIHEISQSLDEDQIAVHMLQFIEYGLKVIRREMDTRVSLEDYRITILNNK
jgi:hypothetical protein